MKTMLGIKLKISWQKNKDTEDRLQENFVTLLMSLVGVSVLYFSFNGHIWKQSSSSSKSKKAY